MAAEKELVVLNERGLHLSSAAQITKTASRFKSSIMLIKGEKTANAKSVLTITALLAPKGTKITVSAEGVDEEKAVAALEKLFNRKFGEP